MRLPCLLFHSVCLLLSSSSLLSSVEALASRSSNKKKTKKPAATKKGFGASKQPLQPALFLPDESPAVQDLLAFLEHHECEGMEGTAIGYHPQTKIRGLFATQDFEAGEYLLGIPFVPTCVTLAVDPDISVAETSDAELGFRLWQKLIHQENNSLLKPYWQSLPTWHEHFDASPDFWTDSQIQALEFPPIIEKTRQRIQSVQQLAAAQGLLKDQEVKELQFATWLVKSRGFSLLKPIIQHSNNNDDEESSSEPPTTAISGKTVLIPYLDMINHNKNDAANAELQVLETKLEEESMYALQAIRPIAKGSEITLCYGTGRETSVEMLCHYGFLPPSNQQNDKVFEKDWNDFAWSTTMEQDQQELQALLAARDDQSQDTTTGKRTILEFRIQMKRALASKQ
ncbi:SET [Seminavis robusta]|uniref:SET n=1 Tax=Seminavis robusta TaxID=568900 RepID=A0A9N8H8V5_9STRA|nr:SET [Seminavis robusta]|eukprot:Sro253_g099860.1 SET (398) ;mRNA; f:32443-33636